MHTGALVHKLCRVCAFTLFLFLITQGTAAGVNQLVVNFATSKPPDSSQSGTLVYVEKGKIEGLLLRFDCKDNVTHVSSNLCFPISNSMSPSVQVKILVSATHPTAETLTCSASTAPPAPHTCSYTLVNQRVMNPNSCGPAGASPCVDTVKIIYNDTFPTFTQIQYSATGMVGASGELQNLVNQVSFTTRSTNTAPTVSMELVFDISGSMDLTTIPPSLITPNPSKRLAALKSAADTFFGILNSYSLPRDKLGLVVFSDFAMPGVDPNPPHACLAFPATSPSPPVVTNLLAADDPANVTATNTCVQNQVATRSTSIGAGLLSAKAGFDLDTTNPNTNKQVLLFSDGLQNTAPNVDPPQPTPPLKIGGNPYPSDIHVCTVTAGRMTAPGFSLQQGIADLTCNHQYDNVGIPPSTSTTDPDAFAQAELQTFFAQFLETAVPTDKLETVADTTGHVLAGSTVTEKFLGASSDASVTIVLSWFGASEGDRILPFQLKAPDGTILNLENLTRLAHNTSFTTLSFPIFQGGVQVAQKGQWELVISGATLHSHSIDYHLLVLADNLTIASDFTIDAHDVGTGEPIPIRVKLSDDGLPILNATVQAQLMGPANSQGNLLSNTPTPPLSSSMTDPASTKGQAKLDALASDPANASLFANNGLPTLTLLDSGNSGVYTSQLTDTSNEGHYYFSIRVRGTSAKGGDFQRSYQIARFVRSKPNAKNTVFKLLRSEPQANGSVLVTLQAIPHDARGNFLGPGYEKDMKIKSSQGTIESPLDDKLDGSYEITYRLPSASSNPSFTIEIMGETVTTKTRKQLQGNTPGRFAVFLDAGANFPHDTFGTIFDKGFSLNAGLEYVATSHFSLEGIFGYHHFPGTITPDLNLYQFSANAKLYWKTYSWGGRPVRLFVNAGPGGYRFSPGSTYFGGNVGAGVLYELRSRFGLQGSYNFHAVNTPVEATKFSTVQGGIRFVF